MSQHQKSSLLDELPAELVDIIALYLPIHEYYQLAICNRNLCEILWNNSRMWSKLMERDELMIPTTQQIDNISNENYCQTCRNIYSNIFNACFEFEKKVKQNQIIQIDYILDRMSLYVNPYRMSENYSAFEKFHDKVFEFDQLRYILKYRKKSLVLRGYIIVETGCEEEFQKEYLQIAQFLAMEKDQEKVKQQIDQDEYEDRTLSEIFIKTHMVAH